MNEAIILFLGILLAGVAILSILRFIHFYNVYQRQLKKGHTTEYKKLIFKDKLVATAGEWIRWPVGSAGPMVAIFNIRQFYGDRVLLTYQKKALTWLGIFLASFILSLIALSK
jgi:hypothetical protein